MLTIVFSTQKFTEYNLGKTTLVQTTLCKPMVAAHLRLKLSGYDLKVDYLPGKK